jgi:hypothetical protein
MLWALVLLVDNGGMEQRRLKSPGRRVESHRGKQSSFLSSSPNILLDVLGS